MARKTVRRNKRNTRIRGGRGGAGGLGGASVGHGDGGFGGRADLGSVDNRAGTLPVNQQQTQQAPQDLGLWADKIKSFFSGGKRTRRNRRNRNKRTKRNKRN